MLKHIFKIAAPLVVLSYLLLAGCVSNLLAPPPPKKADGIKFVAPKADFKDIRNGTVDEAWQNAKNGNTIAYLSECSSKTDSLLKELEAENLAAMSNVEIVESKDIRFNDREALQSTVDGQVDGVDIRLRLLIFKKNGCDYTLSYVGRKKHFSQDESVFKNFTENFQAP